MRLNHGQIVIAIFLTFLASTRRYDEENIITMKLSTGRLQSTDALRIVKYTFYPTQSDIHFLTHLTAPQRVHDVSGSDAAYADFLIGLCQPVTNAS